MDQNQMVQKMEQIMDWSYTKALNGVPGMGSVEELAQDYLKGSGTLEEKVDSLIRWQNAKCATSGFITNLGGVLSMPVGIPANISSVLYVQLRMIAAIAYMGGYDVRDDRVKTLAFVCLCGNSVEDLLKDAGIQIGKCAAKSLIRKIPYAVILKINQMVGFRLVTKFGQKGLINLTKAVPFVGGAIGGLIDGVSTNTIGNQAKKMFIMNQ